MAKLFNLARMTVTGTPGTGTITLNAATANHISFSSAGVSNSDVVAYGIEDGTASEAGFGTYTSAGTTLTRNLVNSTTGSLLSLTSAAEVFITPLARDLVGATQLGSGFTFVNGTMTAAVGSSALTIAIKTLAGADPSTADPVYVVLRNTTAATGDYTILALTAATSVVVSSGSTLGTANSTAFRIWIVGFNDAGTFRLGVINCLSTTSIYPLGQFAIASSTAEGGAGAADSAQVFYTGTAVTSKPYQVLGYASYESGLGTAGTWSATPTRLQLYSAAVPLPGAVIQQARTDTGATANGTTTVPFDDTIPQNTEGVQFMTLSVTPTSAANLGRVRAQAFLNTTANLIYAFSLFRDSTANALVTGANESAGTNAPDMAALEYVALFGSTSSTTFNFRAGTTSAGTIVFNGSTTPARLFGGVANSFIEIQEVMT
jgi:hypothetical protein